MQAYFHRQIQLWGEQTQQSLKDKSLAIIGAGGLGCALGLALSSSGIGKIYIVDYDKVSLSNIHRQIIFEEGDIGENKARVFKRLNKRYKDIELIPCEESAKDFFKHNYSYDLILDATDNMEARFLIDKVAKQINIPWIYTSVESFHTQICFFKNASFDIFKNKALVPAGIAAPIVLFGASFSANLALRYLANLAVKMDTLYYLDINTGELRLKSFEIKS